MIKMKMDGKKRKNSKIYVLICAFYCSSKSSSASPEKRRVQKNIMIEMFYFLFIFLSKKKMNH